MCNARMRCDFLGRKQFFKVCSGAVQKGHVVGCGRYIMGRKFLAQLLTT
jgi:hypothetical protein